MHVYHSICIYELVCMRESEKLQKMPCYFTAKLAQESVRDLTVSNVFCKVFSNFFMTRCRGQVPSCRRLSLLLLREKVIYIYIIYIYIYIYI
jgi:hypothetical protein